MTTNKQQKEQKAYRYLREGSPDTLYFFSSEEQRTRYIKGMGRDISMAKLETVIFHSSDNLYDLVEDYTKNEYKVVINHC